MIDDRGKITDDSCTTLSHSVFSTDIAFDRHSGHCKFRLDCAIEMNSNNVSRSREDT